MNAFHPDYVRTFYPQFLSIMKTEANLIEKGKINGKKARHTRESVKGIKDIKSFPDTRKRS